MSVVLDVRNLSVSLPTQAGLLHAVRGVDLQVGRGETLCIVGESGCGKSMTSLALMGLLPPHATRSADAISFAGHDIAHATEPELQALRGNRIAMVFQEPMTALNPSYPIGDQLTEGLLHHDRKTSPAQVRLRAIELLEICGIADAERRLAQYPHQLSGGLRQRVMIAMALMTNPDLLIADEPTTALDTTIQVQILDLLARLQRELSLAVILITHDFDVVRRCADRVAVMYAGEVVETGPVATVLSHPLHPYTRALLDCVPAEAAAGSRLGTLAGTVPSLVGSLRGCQFRARCRLAHDACENDVRLVPIAADHDVRCVLDIEALRSARPDSDAVAIAEPIAALARDAELAIELRQVRMEYAVPQGLLRRKGRIAALRYLDLQVRYGEVLGIVGESGSGKSTLARLMLGLNAPTSGDVSLRGRPIARFGRTDLARVVQPIFQDPYASLNPRRTVADTIRLPLNIHRIGPPQARPVLVQDMMALCGLPPHLAGAHPSQLSGGQRQRVAIASALVLKPDIVICDEPTSALDVSVQAQILNLFQDLHARLALTYVLISHDLAVIRCLSDRIAVMYFGAIVEQGPASAIFAAPLHPYTQLLLAASSRAPAMTGEATEFPNPMSPPAGCSFRTRCPRAKDICAKIDPVLQPFAQVQIACHFPEIS